MTQRIYEFRLPFHAADGEDYRVRLYGSERGHEVWAGWLLFIPEHGGELMKTGTETEQESPERLLFWSGGVTPAYLADAFTRTEPFPLEPGDARHLHTPDEGAHAS